MQIYRRTFTTGLAASMLTACTQGVERSVNAVPDDLRPIPNPNYDRWVVEFQSRARQRGFSADLLDAAFRGTGYLPGVVTRDRSQTEFDRTLEDYLSIAVSDDRVARGRVAASRYRTTLAAIETAYGVEADIVTAIWGLESSYGDRKGDISVVSATSTLAFDGRRRAFFEDQLFAALTILRRGEIDAPRLNGSWAGGMGHTQFIPTSYLSFAVDFTGDGRRDVWSTDPTDALASTASYLSRNGWRQGLSWGREALGGSLSGAPVIQPQPGGPRFVITANFRVIKRYNNSDAYAIAIGHLADRIGGAPPLQGTFPPDEFGLTKDQRTELQRGLTAAGFETGGADGVIGNRTRGAIGAYQAANGLPVTGTPSARLLDRLR